MKQTDARITELMSRLAVLERERVEILAEINALRSTQSEGTAAIKVSGKAVDRNSTIEKKVALFRGLFRGRSDVFPIRWENRTTGRSGYAPACGNEWQRGICEKPKVKCSACPNQAFLAVDDVSIERHLRGTDTNRRPVRYGRLSDAGRQYLFVLGRGFRRRGMAKEMPSLLGALASGMEYLLPSSGPDPETVLTPVFFSMSRFQRHWRAVLEPS
jgi:hypothetical protein